MRPIAAPHHAAAELGDQLARERHRVGVRRALARGALEAAHLDPEALVLQELEQVLERRLVEAVRGVDAPHVVDHYRHRRELQLGRHLDDHRGLDVELQVPVERRELAREPHQVRNRGTAAQVLDEVEAHAAEALLVQLLQLRHVGVDRDERDADVAAFLVREEVGDGRIVEAVRRRLHHHAALDAEEHVAVDQHFLGRVGRLVRRFRVKRELRLRAEDVEMRVARSVRQLELRLGRVVVVGRLGGVSGVTHNGAAAFYG